MTQGELRDADRAAEDEMKQEIPPFEARHQSLCTHFVRDALAFRFINLKYVATENQFADVFTKAPTAPMLRLLKTLMDGAARVPLLARLYQ